MSPRVAHDITACPCPWHGLNEMGLNSIENHVFQALHPVGTPKHFSTLLDGRKESYWNTVLNRLRPKLRAKGYIIEALQNGNYCLYKVLPPEAPNGEAQP